jgi:hypothetical protein
MMTDSEKMQHYIVQKAQQALEAICEEEPLSKRLDTAKSHLEYATQYLDTASEEVRNRVKAFIESDVVYDTRHSCLALQSAIISVFEEAGRDDVTLGKSGDSTLGSN